MIYDPLLNLIKENPNWREILEAAPKNLRIKQCPYKDTQGNLIYPELYMLSYDGIFSDFNDEIVRLCRGCVISLENPTDPKMIVTPFLKFGNYTESYCPDIDWDSAVVMDKVDGILIKLFNYKDKWIWITNNGWDINISAKDITQLPSTVDEPETEKLDSVMDLIDYSLTQISVDSDLYTELNPNYTYMFELLSPRLRILVDNKKTELVYLGCRNRLTHCEATLEEVVALNPSLKKFRTVDYYNLNTIDEVLALCNSYKDLTKEGVVIRDKYFNRVKIKCADYVKFKYYRDSFATGDEQIYKAILEETIDDAIGIFPELIQRVNEIRADIESYKKILLTIIEKGRAVYTDILNTNKNLNERGLKKLYASWVLTQNPEYKSIYFEAIKTNSNCLPFIQRLHYEDLKKSLDSV